MTQPDSAAETTVAAPAVAPAAGPAEGVLAQIRAALPMLGSSEQRVADVLIAHAGQAAALSTADVAQLAGTSPATVVRACKNMGFSGFQHLRLEIARQEPAEAGGGAEDPVAGVFSAAQDSLAVAARMLDRRALEQAAGAIAAAGTVLMVGNGFSAPPLQDAALRLLTQGVNVHAPADVQAQQFTARGLGAADVCLAVSYSGANRNTLATCGTAREQGATMISVTSFTQSPLMRLTDIALVTGSVRKPHAIDPFQSRLAHMAALQALCMLVEGGDSTVPQMRSVVADSLTEE
ncbi:MurR/RpiR family transcriptional regulator [Sediminivirga luteola]|jgi:DNA-binding MurR/RpiR family transcriptional regulator|uniref:RpiR family transcriptional regulator n=1 Tax=Sediminivirga luteola TaxID=1774748 RepID=A0A8J2TXC8_9MICO|nr:MurR/RpiR family transcriptional regulator [Sediminivirga luteola]MCI2266272.1 MurR/RpiR family transcriptional regulator [Sediminivirga luteola]GGA12249.1 hypothetical protein GCM10011333_13850 [Sediminivirga luteola]